MKLTFVSNYGTINQLVETYEVDMIEFENQEDLNNGMWLNCWTKDGEFGLEFDPKRDAFRIQK